MTVRAHQGGNNEVRIETVDNPVPSSVIVQRPFDALLYMDYSRGELITYTNYLLSTVGTVLSKTLFLLTHG